MKSMREHSYHQRYALFSISNLIFSTVDFIIYYVICFLFIKRDSKFKVGSSTCITLITPDYPIIPS